MAFDGIVTNAIVEELQEKIVGGRIDKVYQPENDEIFIHIRAKGENQILLLSASSNNPRLHLTNNTKENPMKPPMFCMVLRKYLVSSTILDVGQFEMDRIIYIDISSRDELGIDSEKRIIIEIMGRHSNIIIIDKETNKIIDSITRVSQDMSRVRQVFPGIEYKLPPLQDKKNPLKTNKEEFFKLLLEENQDIQVFKFFYSNYQGLSPLISREFCFDSGIDSNRKISDLSPDNKEHLFSSFDSYIKKIQKNNFKPSLILNEEEDKILAFHALEINQFKYSIKRNYEFISDLLDDYYIEKDLLDRIGQKSQSLLKSTKVHLDRAKNKLKYQRQEYKESKDREKYKIYADLISANIHNIGRGLKEVELDNFYDEELGKLLVPLDEKLTPPLNAQKYYKKYSKLKNASNLLKKQIPRTRDEILYLENVLLGIENSTEVSELEEIKDELIKEGFLKGRSNKKQTKDIKSKPYHYMSSEGFSIFVGKNNRQNDNLTFRTGHREDIWMHVQKMPGSHVIIKNEGREVSPQTLEEAALLAGYYSKGRNSSNLAIDYTERKNVRKPRGGRAGLAIYENFNTIFTSPNLKLVNQLKKIK